MKVTAVAMLCLVTTFACAGEKPPFFDKPLVLGAHRGGSNVWPENTVQAMQEATKRWPDVLLEADARLTKDGVVVLMHDKTVDRTTDGSGPVESLTLAGAKALDAAYDFTQDGGATFPLRGTGVKIPTLQEVLEAAPTHRFLVEFKTPDTVSAVVKAVRDAHAEARVLFASFNAAAMQALAAEMPESLRCYDMSNSIALLGALRGDGWPAYQPVAHVLSVPTDLVAQVKLTAEEIQKIRAKGIVFQIHTLNTEAEMRDWLAKGVDSILTDDPKLLARILAEKE